jgi:hypothetical protein
MIPGASTPGESVGNTGQVSTMYDYSAETLKSGVEQAENSDSVESQGGER